MSDINEEVVEVPPEPPRPVGTFYLRFSSEEEFLQAAEEAGFVKENVLTWKTIARTILEQDENDEWVETISEEQVPDEKEKVLVKQNYGYFIDVIGKITRGGEWEWFEPDDRLITIVEPVELEGWHVNYSGVLPKSFQNAWIDPPNSPVRGFVVGALGPNDKVEQEPLQDVIEGI